MQAIVAAGTLVDTAGVPTHVLVAAGALSDAASRRVQRGQRAHPHGVD
jgi:hypothetical protein